MIKLKIIGSYRIARGGSWRYYDSYCTVSRRYSNYPSYRCSGIGLRPARRIHD